MKRKPVIALRQAEADIDGAFEFYLAEAGGSVAANFANALDNAFAHISRHPSSGSTRYSYEVDLPDIRFWHVSGFPYHVFYTELDSHIEVWRLLHSHSDILSILLITD